MADGGATFFYIASALVAGGTAVQTIDTIQANRQRQAVLEAELRSNELAALDEENQRLLALREANDEMLARSGGVDAWASPSLLAARAFNFRMTEQDVDNIRYNLAESRASISAKIAILKRNSRATLVKGIFDMGASIFAAMGEGELLKKGKPKKKPTLGKGGPEV